MLQLNLVEPRKLHIIMFDKIVASVKLGRAAAYIRWYTNRAYVTDSGELVDLTTPEMPMSLGSLY